MAEVLPFMLIKPTIVIGGTWVPGVDPAPPSVPTGGTDITCFGHKVEFKPDESSDDLEGFCFTARSYKPTRLAVTLSMFQSFGADNLWDVLVPLEKQDVPLAITPAASSSGGTVDNPTWFAMVHVPPIPFLNADVGEASDFDLDFDVQGSWYYTPVPGSGALVTATAAAPSGKAKTDA
jgi:hypothetical protein